MKKSKIAALLIALMLCVSLAACTKTYTVKFDLDGGSIDGGQTIASQTVTSGEKAKKPEGTMSKEKHRFDNWYNGSKVWSFSDEVTQDMTLVAKWIEQVTVTFDLGGGKYNGSETAPTAQTIDKNAEASKPTGELTKENLYFDNWYLKTVGGVAETAYVFTTPVTSDITLVAVWTDEVPVVKFTATFDLAGGLYNGGATAPAAQTINENDNATRPAGNMTKDGFTFVDWYLKTGESVGETPYDFNTPVTADITLVAVWTDEEPVEQVTVTFDLGGGKYNGGTMPPAAQTFDINDKATRPAGAMTKDGHVFEGWFLKTGENVAANPYNFSDAVTANITLVAVWLENGIPSTERVMVLPELTSNTYWTEVWLEKLLVGRLQFLLADERHNVFDPLNFIAVGFYTLYQEYGLFSGIKIDGQPLSHYIETTGKIKNPIAKGLHQTECNLDGRSLSFPLYISDVYSDSGLEYLVYNNEVIIYGCTTDKGPVSIPATIDGMTVTGIATKAFDGKKDITSINIPASITYIGNLAFTKTTTLQSINVNAQNQHYKDDDGVLFTADGGTLLAYPAGKPVTTYRVPEGVKTISPYTFNSANKLVRVDISDSVITIGTGCFYDNLLLDTITIGKNVQIIESYAFASVPMIMELNLPASLTTIGDGVFKSCTLLDYINVDPASTSFKDDDGALYTYDGKTMIKCPETVEECEILEGTETIASYCFYACVYLTNVVIPDSVTKVGIYAFGNCIDILTVRFPKNLEYIGANAFFSCPELAMIQIPASVTYVGMPNFRYCNKLSMIGVNAQNANYKSHDGVLYSKDGKTLVRFPGGKSGSYTILDDTEIIADYAFHTCEKLYEIVISDTVKTIGNAAFYGCRALMDVTMPDSVTGIGSYAFYNCIALTEIVLSSNAEYIGHFAFSRCKLWEIEIPASVKMIGDGAFSSCMLMDTVTLHEGLEYIGEYAFHSCHVLSTISIPDSVTYIGIAAFQECMDLDDVTIGNGAVYIDDLAFEGCTELTTITIGTGVVHIGDGAFLFTSITKLTVLATVPPVLVASALARLDENAVILVPNASLSAYKAATGWIEYADQIRGIEEPAEQVTVTFDLAGGKYDGTETPPAAQTFDKDGKASKPAGSMTKDGFSFDDWYLKTGETISETAFNFDTPVTENITLVAGWTENEPAEQVTVTFDLAGGKYDGTETPPAAQTFDKDGKATEPTGALTKDGFTFTGWYQKTGETISETAHNFDTPVTENITLVAGWTAVEPAEQVTVTFDLAGGKYESTETPPAAQTFDKDGKATEPTGALTKDGFTFTGWYLKTGETISETAYNFDTPVNGNITLVAGWTENSGTPVTFADIAGTWGGTNSFGEQIQLVFDENGIVSGYIDEDGIEQFKNSSAQIIDGKIRIEFEFFFEESYIVLAYNSATGVLTVTEASSNIYFTGDILTKTA